MIDSLIVFFSDYGYFAVFGTLLLCGLGLPIPEDVTLVAGGVMAGLACPEAKDIWSSAARCQQVHMMPALSMAGVLTGDLTMMTLGRLLGERVVENRWIGRFLSESRLETIRNKVSRYGPWIVFAARFMPGLRSPIFVVTGMTRRIGYLRFVLVDGAAALISVPVWVSLGYLGAQHRTLLASWIKEGEAASFILLGVVVLFFLVRLYLKRRQASH